MIEIQTPSIESAVAHQQAIQNAQHLLHCAHHLTDNMPEDMMIVGDLSVLLSKIEEEVIAAKVRFQPVEKQQAEAPRPVVAPWRDYINAENAKQEAGKQALSELRSALMQQTIMIRRLADNAGIEDINTEHEATKLAKEIYFAMDRAWDCVSRATV